MKRIFTLFSFLLALSFANAAPFTTGNIVVVRLGTGSGTLSAAAAAVFLDEYTPTGVFIQTVALPTSVSGTNLRLTTSGSSTSEGGINLSSDGYYLTLMGYDADPGTASVNGTTSASVRRVVGVISGDGTINTSTGLTDAYNANSARSAYTTNGTSIWTAGTATNQANGFGLRYTTVGASTSTLLSTDVTNIRAVSVYNGQLLVTSASGTNIGVNSVGSGTPTTSGQTISLFPGFPTSSSSLSPYAFDIKPTSGDIMYVADDRASSSGGVQKWVLNNGTWSNPYTINPASNIGARSITVNWSGTTPVMYVTGTDNKVYQIIDNGSNSLSTKTVLITAATNTAFRGIAFAPTPQILPLHLLSFTASPKNNNVELAWKTSNEVNTRHFEIEQSLDGKNFKSFATVTAAGNTTGEKSYGYTTSLNAVTTYYRLKMVDADGKSTLSAIVKVAPSKSGFALGSVYPVPAKNGVTVEWNSNRAGATTLVLTDISGRTIKMVNMQAMQGFNRQVLDVQSLSAGQYFLRIKNDVDQIQTIITKQ